MSANNMSQTIGIEEILATFSLNRNLVSRSLFGKKSGLFRMGAEPEDSASANCS
jgi:hypothetical protein